MWRPRSELSSQCVRADRWDWSDVRLAAKEIKAFGRARRGIADHVPTGTEAVNDMFFLLLKADPTLRPVDEVAPGYLVNRAVILELSDLAATRRLRQYTVGDRVQAAMACLDLLPALEGLFDRLAVLMSQAEQADELAEKVEDLYQEMLDAQSKLDEELGQDPSPEDFAAAKDTADVLADLKDQFSQLQTMLEDGAVEALVVQSEREAMLESSAFGAVVDEVADSIEQMMGTTRAWGIEPGDLQRMSAAQRVALARKLESPHIQAIADLFGRIENFALSAPADQIEDAHEEVYDLELGNELTRLAPSEFLYLAEPVFEPMFLSRWVDRELMQYAVRGRDDAGRGGIVMCLDGSGSMNGARAVFAGALMLVLLHQARRQQRPMHVIHFGGYRRAMTYEFTAPEHFTPARLLDAAEVFYGGGTDFETPMQIAVDTLRAEFDTTGATSADVVFVTDDECAVEKPFMAWYLDEMRQMAARTWGVLVSPIYHRDGALAEMAEGRVLTVSDLTSGHDVGRLLRNAF